MAVLGAMRMASLSLIEVALNIASGKKLTPMVERWKAKMDKERDVRLASFPFSAEHTLKPLSPQAVRITQLCNPEYCVKVSRTAVILTCKAVLSDTR